GAYAMTEAVGDDARYPCPACGAVAEVRTGCTACGRAATPATRDRYVDFIRVLSITAVIIGHWLLSMLTLYGAGQLPFHLPFQLVTWVLQVMPLFFAVGGFSHAKTLASLRRQGGTYGQFLRSRTARLLPPVLVLLAVWAAVAAVLE